MLVLSRKKDEAIRIGADVKVVVVRTGQVVRIGIECPPDMKIVRDELADFSTNAPNPYPPTPNPSLP